MKKKIIKPFLIVALIFLNNCGFKVVDLSSSNNFTIKNIISTGDKKINYKLKNKLKFNSKNQASKTLFINLDTKKNKVIKERNIKNQITKYSTKIIVNVKYQDVNSNSKGQFTVTKSGDYQVTSQHSGTLRNEKKLDEQLTEKLAEKILNELKQL